MTKSSVDNTSGEVSQPSPNAGFTPSVLPEVHDAETSRNSHTGVSTNYAHTSQQPRRWYALRTTYGRELKAYDYIISHGGTAYCPTILGEVRQRGEKVKKAISRIPNIFFAYGTENEVKDFVYDNVHLPFLRFYYRHRRVNGTVMREPLIVPDRQIADLRILSATPDDDILITPNSIDKFREGQEVLVTQGDFAGFRGHIARHKGQQRVGIVIEGLCTIATAYVPTAFLQPV